MRLYTKTGDKGQTGLIGGLRVSKDHPRVSAYGDVDELNASVGWAATTCDDAEWCGRMQSIQDRLFVVGAQLANPAGGGSAVAVVDADVKVLERWIDEASEAVVPLNQFILPGGCELASRFHVSRTVCRRAERNVVALARENPEAMATVVYLNRLADLLFAWARLANARAGVADIVWTSPAKAD